MRIQIKNEKVRITFELNDSDAANDLYQQLPVTTIVKNFGSNEKIFYPNRDLGIKNTPMANATLGSLTYYAPWGNIALFYGHFGKGPGLYSLGEAISGKDLISKLRGEIEITAV